jgi:hypothetical protein
VESTPIDPAALLATRAVRVAPVGLKLTDRLLRELKSHGRP